MSFDAGLRHPRPKHDGDGARRQWVTSDTASSPDRPKAGTRLHLRPPELSFDPVPPCQERTDGISRSRSPTRNADVHTFSRAIGLALAQSQHHAAIDHVHVGPIESDQVRPPERPANPTRMIALSLSTSGREDPSSLIASSGFAVRAGRPRDWRRALRIRYTSRAVHSRSARPPRRWVWVMTHGTAVPPTSRHATRARTPHRLGSSFASMRTVRSERSARALRSSNVARFAVIRTSSQRSRAISPSPTPALCIANSARSLSSTGSGPMESRNRHTSRSGPILSADT